LGAGFYGSTDPTNSVPVVETHYLKNVHYPMKAAY